MGADLATNDMTGGGNVVDGREGRRFDVGKLPAAVLAPLLARYASLGDDVLVGPGIGRDATAVRVGDRVLVAKTDPITFASRDAAAYLVDVNANDLVCLGARPRWLLVTALFPADVSEREVEEQFAGLAAACARQAIGLVGGHTEVSAAVDRAILVGMMLGETTEDRLVQPGRARPGDRLLVSKGIAIEGTALLATERESELVAALGPDIVRRARALLRDPGLSIAAEVEAMLPTGGITALHDPTEGGLVTGVRELAAASDCGATLWLDVVPILAETRAIADYFGIDPAGMLASGSALVAARPDTVGTLSAAAAEIGVEITEIGELRAASDGFLAVEGGAVRPLPEWSVDEVSRVLATPASVTASSPS